jgi:ribosomal protein S18 acetylase RimI-like enzyme
MIMENIKYYEIGPDQLEEYGKIPFCYDADKKYELNKVDNGLGGILLELVDVEPYHKDFGPRVDRWKEMFDIFNWKFFVASNENDEIIAGCTVVTRTPDCNMLEGRNDLAILWDIRVAKEYRHQGIGQHLFGMAEDFAKENGFKQLKVECQNTNPDAVRFYHKQGMMLCAINEFAYPDCPNEAQLLWYMDL